MDTPDFAGLGAHPALARAIATKGYTTPSPVQAAVLAAPARDLLVSAQTGSGKTLAFGLIVGQLLLGEEEKFARSSAKPRALVIAPTRELAAQVQRELTWLYAGAHGRVLSVTGGTNLGLDQRALSRGVDVLVGTPGRLVDLIERKWLDLSGLEAVVLDEADEMLDLGFREALETLLQAAPTERRTMLFSATLPPGIKALAKRYQKEALGIDPRDEIARSGAAHEDIEHVAHLVANGERIQALANVLRLAGDDRAIVFGRTREDVAELHRQLAQRGFRATFISGERAQTERTRALEALRDGRVRILVATNVAARGLDLPDVNLVVHSDLAENADSLTHRAGRTGRAGKKGTNVFLVEERARRKAERLFAEAKLKIRFTAAPDAAAVAAHDRAKLATEVADALGKTATPTAQAFAESLLDRHDAVQVVAALADRALAAWPAGEKLSPVRLDREVRSAPSSSAGPGSHASGGHQAMVPFRVSLGRAQGADPRWILPLVCARGGVGRKDVGAIRVTRAFTLVEIAANVAESFARKAAVPDKAAPGVTILRDGPGASAPVAGGGMTPFARRTFPPAGGATRPRTGPPRPPRR